MSEADAKAVVLETADIMRIMQLIPHRYPFLMIDRVVDIEHGESAVGIKNVTINEPFFQGHFPNKPIMPGVMIIESMAQTAAVLVMETLGEDVAGKLVYFLTIDECRFRRLVGPGDTLRIHVRKHTGRGRVWRMRCEAKVDGQVTTEALISAMIVKDTQA